jgi:hypothetical protein
MGYRYVFNLQQWIPLMAAVHLSIYGTNGCFIGLEISSSNCDGRFCCAFRMSLEKVECFTKKLIARGYLPPP